MAKPHISVQIVEHVTSGKDVTALINTLENAENSDIKLDSASAGVVSALDSLTSFIAKTPGLKFIAASAVDVSLDANRA